MKLNIFKKWDENTDISWWRESRNELNKIIDIYNNWQMEYNFDKERAKVVLSNIEYGKQTIGSKNGGSGYLEELIEMEKFVRECIINNDITTRQEPINEPRKFQGEVSSLIKWVSVKDRLPLLDGNKQLFVWILNGFKYEIEIARFNKWGFHYGTRNTEDIITDVLFWAECPEPPFL